MKDHGNGAFGRKPIDFADLDELFHPALAFGHPNEVVNDPDLTLNEKRAILSSWASDACAVEEAPALRRAHGSDGTVTIDDILEALQALDRQPRDESLARLRRQMRRSSFEQFKEGRARR